MARVFPNVSLTMCPLKFYLAPYLLDSGAGTASMPNFTTSVKGRGTESEKNENFTKFPNINTHMDISLGRLIRNVRGLLEVSRLVKVMFCVFTL